VTLLADAIYSNPLLLGYAWQKGWIPLQHASLVRAIELNGVSVDKNRLAFEWGRYLAHHGEAVVRALLPGAPVAPAAASAQVVAMPQTLDSLIRKREAMLTEYQNAAYAARYRSAVERIRAAEQQLGIDRKLPLTEAVARNLAKLMAYKDEYEVARLYTDPAFLDKLRAQFEGEPGRDYQLNFWLAPPLLAKADAKGHLVKRRFGPRTMTAFRLLARLKGLRGTALDVFGKTAERRAERALVSDYLAMVEEFAGSLSADNLDTALALAALPDDIRGYGHVKEASMAAAAVRREALLAQYRVAARRDAA